MSLFAKCRYTRSLIICITVGWDFALGMEILSLFVVMSAVVISEVDCTCSTVHHDYSYIIEAYYK